MGPDNGQYFAAIGAVEFGKDEDPGVGTYRGWAGLEFYVSEGRKETRKGASVGLSSTPEDLEGFRERYRTPDFMPAEFNDGEVVRAQEGDFYGGWITSEIVGPFKGASGTMGW